MEKLQGFQATESRYLCVYANLIINDLKKENSLDLHLEEAWTGSVSL